MAKKSTRQSAARGSGNRWLAIAAIAAFIVVDVVLVALALQSTAPNPSGSRPLPVPTAEQPADTASPAPTDSPEPVTASTPTRILSTLDADVAWRSTTGPCPDATAAPELTTDGGATWTPADITSATGVMALQRIVVSDEVTATFLGAGADCAPAVVRTFVAGADFAEYPDQLAGSWYLSPVGSATVHSPSGDVQAPCDSVLTVAPLDAERAAVLCGDSSIHLTGDGGSTWAVASAVPGAVTITEAADGYLVGSAGSAECAGVLLTALTDTGSTNVGCARSDLPADQLATATAIDWNAEAIWVWVGDTLMTSTDEGQTWT